MLTISEKSWACSKDVIKYKRLSVTVSSIRRVKIQEKKRVDLNAVTNGKTRDYDLMALIVRRWRVPDNNLVFSFMDH